MHGNQIFEFIWAGWEYLEAKYEDFPLDCTAETENIDKLICQTNAKGRHLMQIYLFVRVVSIHICLG